MRKKMSLMSVDEASMYLREVIYIPPHQIRLQMHLLYRASALKWRLVVLHPP